MKKVYEKPYLEVVEYVGDCSYASSSTSTCLYLTCLIGQQKSEGISGLTIYQFTYNNTTYYMWYHVYSDDDSSSGGSYSLSELTNINWDKFSSNNNSGTGGWYQDLINFVYSYTGSSSGTDGAKWHIATDSDSTFNAS